MSTKSAADTSSGTDTPSNAPDGTDDSEAGSGMFSMCFGLLFFLGFLFLAAQVLVTLYARSVVSAAAYDAARIIAVSDGDGTVQPERVNNAEGRARARVQELLGQDASLRIVRVDLADSLVEVEVTKPRPRLLLGGGTLGDDTLTAHAIVRLEQLQ